MASDQPTERPVELPHERRFDRRVVEPPEAESLDWQAIETDPDYRELRAMRGRYIAPAAIVCFAAYFAFLVVAVNDPGLLGNAVHRGFTLGYLLMIVLFVIVWAVVLGYARMARRHWDPRVERVRADALERQAQPAAPAASAGTSPAAGAAASRTELTP